jgi:hypothetical protein
VNDKSYLNTSRCFGNLIELIKFPAELGLRPQTVLGNFISSIKFQQRI